ncbi:hypothetical protein GCM10007170_22600 [Arthrobacter liuii]|uniref:Secreted protein n=1 Tax=Arthrobacter liuii TaxID=1476996 RepID=A0ABQ2ARR1_9MICC|nr:hypothetical protein GCM10007170_22600 [Arthrobacter liuii]
MSRCRATFMMVSFRITTNVATSSVLMMVTDSRDIFSGAAGWVPGRIASRTSTAGTGWPPAFGETSVDMGVPSGIFVSDARSAPLQVSTLYPLE